MCSRYFTPTFLGWKSLVAPRRYYPGSLTPIPITVLKLYVSGDATLLKNKTFRSSETAASSIGAPSLSVMITELEPAFCRCGRSNHFIIQDKPVDYDHDTQPHRTLLTAGEGVRRGNEKVGEIVAVEGDL